MNIPTDKQPRARRHRPDLREELLRAAVVEFAEHGFEGASTQAIARRASAHQPQINYHFDSKESLWKAAVDRLFGQLADTLGDVSIEPAGVLGDLADAVAEMIVRFVRFVAVHPELNRIVVHEATARTDRLDWLVEQHVGPIAAVGQAAWRRLREGGVAAPIDERFVHHVIVGAASLVYVNGPEFERIHGIDPTSHELVRRHGEGLVAMLLPGR